MSRGCPPFISRYEKHLKKCQERCQAKADKYTQKAKYYGEELAKEQCRLGKKQ